MNLGAFSVSLAVEDIKKSHLFYQHLGFEKMGGNIDENWLILKNGETVIGLFQGMFPNNIMTFNPGWNQQAANLDKFEDIRDIEKRLRSTNVKFTSSVKEETKGPGSFTLEDPDGNVILFDQHR